jgi:hypothetical protein
MVPADLSAHLVRRWARLSNVFVAVMAISGAAI